MKTNVVLVSLLDEFNKRIALKIAKDLDLYFADVSDFIEYNLVNESEIENACGTEYLNNLKNKTIKEVSTYENTLISINHSLFLSEKNAENLRRYGTIIFLKFPKSILEKEIEKTVKNKSLQNDLKVNLLAFDEHNKLCEKKSDTTIEFTKYENEYVYKKIMKVLNQYFL